MRSRYSAYALAMVDYIIDTTDPTGPQWDGDRARWRRSISAFSQGTEFLGLRLLGHEGDDMIYYVTFEAALSQNGRDAGFRERSVFRREGGRWLYRSGMAPGAGLLGG